MTDSTHTPKDSVHIKPEPQPTEPAPDFAEERSKAHSAGLLDEVIENGAAQRDVSYKDGFKGAGRGKDRVVPGMDR